MEGWVVTLDDTILNGDLTQLYPSWTTTGVNPATATNGQQIRQPCEGTLGNLQVKTDTLNSGYIEIWDVNGGDAGADVSSATAITNAQLVALQARGLAKLIYTQNFIASPETPFNVTVGGFQRGLAGRFVASGGTCTLSMSVVGGFRFTTKVG